MCMLEHVRADAPRAQGWEATPRPTYTPRHTTNALPKYRLAIHIALHRPIVDKRSRAVPAMYSVGVCRGWVLEHTRATARSEEGLHGRLLGTGEWRHRCPHRRARKASLTRGCRHPD